MTTRRAKTDAERLREIRKAARELLREIAYVPFRAVDCDQEAVNKAWTNLAKLSGFR